MVTILLIDDEQPLLNEVSDWLSFEGYQVLTAANGREGLGHAVQHTPDLIICDVAMPQMNGHNVLLEVRSNPALNSTPFIFLTASADYDSMRAGMNLGADDYLTKPFRRTDLLDAIETRLQKHNTQQVTLNRQMTAIQDALQMEQEKRLLTTRLVAMFSHDFRNPLAGILSSAQLLENYQHRMTPQKQTKHLQRIGGSVQLLLQMLDEMLLLAEMEHSHLTYQPEDVNLSELVRTILDEFHIIYQDTHHFALPICDRVTISSDARLLRHILVNLLSNAVKYSPSDSEVVVSLQSTRHCIALSVSDDGIGISETDQARIFDPFYRAKNGESQKGTGLGLTIVQEAVDLCGGELTIDSQVGHGTTFTVSFPVTSF